MQFHIILSFIILIATATSQLHAATQSTSILVFGDFGTGDANQEDVANEMTRFCFARNCDFGVTTGDNVYPFGVQILSGKPNYDILRRYFVGMYVRIHRPIYMSLGNHDIGNEEDLSDLYERGSETNRRVIQVMKNEIGFHHNGQNPLVPSSTGTKKRLWYLPSAYYHAVEKQDVHLFAIDTNTFPHAVLDENNQPVVGKDNFAQQSWLVEELHKSPGGWKIVFGHMPIYSHGRHGYKHNAEITEFREQLLPILCDRRVDFYVSGHDHHLEINKHQCENGHLVTTILSGAAGKGGKDGIVQKAFFTERDPNLIWANGKRYLGDKSIYKAHDLVFGFAHLEIRDDGTAVISMKITKGGSAERTDGCFMVHKGKSIVDVGCDQSARRSIPER